MELGPDAKQLVDAGRATFKPTAADRERVLQALLPRLGIPFVPDLPPTPPAGGGFGALAKVAFTVLGIGVVGGGVIIALPSEEPKRASAPSASASVELLSEMSAPLVPSVEPPSEPVVEQVATPTTRAPRSEDRLAEEVAILSRAGAALRSGRPAAALQALDEHQRRFPSGVLAQERGAARVQALCALGRVAEGVAELKRLERIAPESPHVARARKACDLDRAKQ
jgi:hypothetical protein